MWRSRGLAAAVIAVVLTTASFLYARRSTTHATPDPQGRQAVRITFDAGLQFYPAWSPDGERIAYGSDRAGNSDIWVQQIAGGPPVQLTDDPAEDWLPSWSPDGSRIVFRSERDGGALFVVSALGGPARQLTSFGYRPLWSPDGVHVLFYETLPRVMQHVPRIFVVSDDGSPPTQVFQTVPRPLDTCCWRGYGWHPDGRISVFWGKARSPVLRTLDGQGGWHFWTASLDGTHVVRSEMAPEVLQHLDKYFKRGSGWLPAIAWAPSGDAVYLVSNDGQAHTVWRIVVDPVSLRWVRGPERLTSGPGPALNLALARNGHRIAFASTEANLRMYTFPFDPVRARLTGEGLPLPDAAPQGFLPELSPDGQALAYDTALDELRIHSFANGKEVALFERDEFWRVQPRWSRDGSSLLYNRGYRANPQRQAVVRLTLANRHEELLTSLDSDLYVLGDWTSDGRWIAIEALTMPSAGVKRWRVAMWPTSAAPHAEAQERVIYDDPARRLFPHRISPDDRWITLTGGPPDRAEGSKLFVMPLTGGPLMPIVDGPSWEWQDYPQWAPDGRTIYFVSDRDGFFNVWGRRFDPAQGPTGPLIQITRLNTVSRMIGPFAGGPNPAFAVSADRLVLPLFGSAGNCNIWMIDNIDR